MTLDALMAEGHQALQAGDVAVALDAYERAAVDAPDDLGLAWIRGVLMVRLERYQDALPHLVRAQGLAEQAPSVWTHLGIAHTYLGNPDEAMSAFQRAVQAAPEDPNVRVRLATALNDTGAHADALGVLDQAVALAKEPVVAGFLFLQRGIALNALACPDAALAALDLVGELGGDAHALAALGLQRAAALNALDRPTEALEALDAAGGAARPGPVAAQRAAALNALGRHEEALQAIPDARADASTAQAAWLEDGIALVGVGRAADALAVLDPMVGELVGPARARALEAQGTAQRAQGRPADAARTLTEAAGGTPPGVRRRTVMVALAWSLAEIGRGDDASRAMAEAANEGPPDAELEQARSALLLSIDRPAEAAEALARAVRLQPSLADDPAVGHQRLALALAAGGQGRAAQALEVAAATDARHAPLLRVARAEALFAEGLAAEAVAQLEDVVAHDGDGEDPIPLVGRALAALALGRVDDAVEAFDGAVAVGADADADASNRTTALTGALVALAAHHPDDAREAAAAVAAAGVGRDGLAELVAGMAAADDGDRSAAADAFDRAGAHGASAPPVTRLAGEQRAWLAVAWDDPNAGARFAALPPTTQLGPAGAVGASGGLLLGPLDEQGDQRSAEVAGAAAALPAGHPARTLAAVARGVVLGREGRHDEALFAYEHGLEQGDRPSATAGDAAALLGMGATYLHLEDPEPALQAFLRAHDHAHERRAGVLALIGQGDALARLGDGEKAIEANRAAVRLEPSTARTWLGLAAAYQRLQRWTAADSALARATALGGGEAAAHLRTLRPAEPAASTVPVVRSSNGSWLGFWFSSGAGRRIVGLLLVTLVVALGVLAVVEPSQVDGLDWLRDDGVGGIAAALLGVVALLVAPGLGNRAAPAPTDGSAGASATAALPEPPPSVPLPGAADLVATARAAGAAGAALVLAADVVRAGPSSG